jgi:hypothetical protein
VFARRPPETGKRLLKARGMSQCLLSSGLPVYERSDPLNMLAPDS